MKSKYNITDYTKQQAEKLGVTVKPSSNVKKKLDVFDKNGKLITKIGDSNYKDYGTYIKEKGLAYADKRRELYKIRHNKDRKTKGSTGYYADNLLW